MSFSHEYDFPMFISNGSVRTSGHSSLLAPAQLGLFLQKDHLAVSGPVSKWDALKVIQGSLHSKDKLGLFYGGVRKSDESPAFLTSGILEFHKSLPRKAGNEEWVIGWDGVDDATNMTFEADKGYAFKVKVWGEDVYGTYLRPVERYIEFKTDCSTQTGCDEVCDDTVAGKKYAKLIADKINNDPELKFFLHAEAIFSDAEDNAATHRLYNLRVCDDGTVMALAAVQVSAGDDFAVVRIGRDGTTSIYETVTVLDGPDGSPVAVPANFTASAPFVLQDCDTCPTGYTTVIGVDTYNVTRPIDSDTDLSTTNLQNTYADAIALEYFPANTFNGATAVEVVASSDAITLTAHKFVTGQRVTYANGGGTSVVGLTTATDYYIIKVDANTVKLATTAANAFAGTAIAIADGVGAAHTLTPVVVGDFLSQNGATATIQIKVAHGATIASTIDSDAVSLVASTETTCTPPAGSSIAWVAGEDRYKTTRTLKLKLEKTCGGSNRLADVVAAYASNDEVAVAPTVATAGDCSDIYTITQYSNNLLEDGCLTNPPATFNELPSFEGFSWVPDAEAAGDTTVKVGVRVRTAYVGNTQFGGCSFHPNDYYSVRPLSMEITEYDETGRPCVAPIASRKIKYASMPTQSGEFIIREFIKASKYRVNGEYWNDPRLREVLDSVATSVVDRNKAYVIYYFKIMAHRPTINHVGDFSPEIYEMRVVAPLGTDMTAFENLFSSVASQNGVALQVR